MSKPGLDALWILGAYSLGILAMLYAYYLGGRTWKDRFSISTKKGDGTERIVPGQWGEAGTLSIVCGILLLITYLTRRVYISQIVAEYRYFVAGILICLIAAIFIYSICICCNAKQKEKRPETYCRELRRGYMSYNFYSIVNYAFVIFIVALILLQFYSEVIEFNLRDVELQNIINKFEQVKSSSAESAITYTETISGRTLMGAIMIMDQIGTLLLIILSAFVAYFTMAYTPLRQIWEKEALRFIHGSFIAFIFLVGIVTWIIYFRTYLTFFDRSIEALQSLRPIIESGSADNIADYNYVMLDLVRRRGPTGFLLNLTSENGGIFGLGIIPWLWGRRHRTKSRNVTPPATLESDSDQNTGNDT